MIRIRGHIGQWPVDVSIELDAEDWQNLAQNVAIETHASPPEPDISQALSLLDTPIEGPALLAQLESMLGSSAAAKRMLVRLRHSNMVLITTQESVQVWQRKA